MNDTETGTTDRETVVSCWLVRTYNVRIGGVERTIVAPDEVKALQWARSLLRAHSTPIGFIAIESGKDVLVPIDCIHWHAIEEARVFE